MRHPFSILVSSLLLTALPAVAQTPPTPDTTFNVTGPAAWGTGGNWDSGVPTGSSNALIGDNNTVTMTQSNADTFGTLTLGTNSTAQLSVGNNQGLKTGANVYLNPGSHLNYVSGSSNRDNNVYVVPGGAPATYTLNGALRGTVQGDGDLNIILKNSPLHRASLLGYSGDMTISSSGGTRSFNTWGSNSQYFGSGTTTFANQVYFGHRAHTIHNSGTVRLEGAGRTGSTSYKWDVPAVSGAGSSETIANLIIHSPAANSNPYIIAGNSGNSGGVRVTDTATFSGTAGTVDLRNGNGGSFGGAKRADYPEINAGKYVFDGTGTWNIIGSRSFTTYDYDLGTLGMANGGNINSGGVITTNTDTHISASISGDAGFSKRGSAKLTVTGEIVKLASQVIVEQGELAIVGAIDGLWVWAGTQLGLGADNVAGDTLEILFPAAAFPFILEDNTSLNWQYNGATAAGTDYDTIIAEEWDLWGITNITINGTGLGYTPQNGDSFHIFQGDILEYDVGKFTLNMPVVANGSWELEQDATGLKVNFVGTAPYDVWAGGTFANPFNDTGVSQNPDGDISNNLMEFAFGTDPTVNYSGSMATDGSAHGQPTLEPNGSTMEFYFVRRDDHGTSGSASYTVQFSSDLGTFYDSAVTPTFVADSSVNSDYEVVKVAYPASLPNSQPARFGRVEIEQAP